MVNLVLLTSSERLSITTVAQLLRLAIATGTTHASIRPVRVTAADMTYVALRCHVGEKVVPILAGKSDGGESIVLSGVSEDSLNRLVEKGGLWLTFRPNMAELFSQPEIAHDRNKPRTEGECRVELDGRLFTVVLEVLPESENGPVEAEIYHRNFSGFFNFLILEKK